MKHRKTNDWIQLLILLGIGLLSAFLITKVVSAPGFHAKTIESLDAKRSTIMELTAGASAASVAVAAIPGDATTPIANELAQLNSFFVISLGAVLLEKYLLTVIGYGVFRFMIPAACALAGLGILFRNISLRSIGIKLALAGIAFFLVVPVSVGISNLIENTYQVSSIVNVDVTELEEATQSVSRRKKLWPRKPNPPKRSNPSGTPSSAASTIWKKMSTRPCRTPPPPLRKPPKTLKRPPRKP